MKNYYRVYDNSFCRNIKTSNPASLVQQHDEWYSPDKNEDGARFEIVSDPYVEYIVEGGHEYGNKDFINVKSTLTGNIYRVLYNKHAILSGNYKFNLKYLIN